MFGENYHSVLARAENSLEIDSLFWDTRMYVCIKEYENVHKRHVQYKLNENMFKPIETSPHLSQQCKQRK